MHSPHWVCTSFVLVSPIAVQHFPLQSSSSSSQEQVEAAAEEEIKELVEHKERVERRRAEVEARQRLAEKEQEDMGVMWGIGE